MTHSKKLFHFTLIDFQGEVLGETSQSYTAVRYAVGRAGELQWSTDNCARVIVETDWGFHVTIEWGVRRNY